MLSWRTVGNERGFQGGKPIVSLSASSGRFVLGSWPQRGQKMALCTGGDLTFPGVYGARGWLVSVRDLISDTQNRKSGIVRTR